MKAIGPVGRGEVLLVLGRRLAEKKGGRFYNHPRSNKNYLIQLNLPMSTDNLK